MKRRNFETSKFRNERRSERSDVHASHDDWNDLDVSTFRRFDVSQSPDLTHRIMGRMGYMRVGPKVARRRRLWLWINRTGMALIAAVALWLGGRVYINSPEARHAHELTIPAAIGSDLQQHQRRIGNVFDVIRNLSPAPLNNNVPHEPDPLEEPQMLDADFAQPVAAPFRWA